MRLSATRVESYSMKISVFLFILIIVTSAQAADWVNYCGEIKSMRTWASGSDTYGIWFEYKVNPDDCSSGFYVAHEASNKNYVFSQALAAKTTNAPVCIQTSLEYKISEMCKLNSIKH